jgi:dihydropteroate synthase
LPELRQLGYPLLLGVSRKKFIGTLVAKQNEPPVPPAERVYGTVAAIALAVANGADIVRVHDVAAVAGALRVIDRIVRAD